MKKEIKKGESWCKGHQSGFDEALKACGGCRHCWGKGYSTIGTAGEVRTEYCLCARGAQLSQVMTRLIAQSLARGTSVKMPKIRLMFDSIKKGDTFTIMGATFFIKKVLAKGKQGIDFIAK